jgi:hypothetical protein
VAKLEALEARLVAWEADSSALLPALRSALASDLRAAPGGGEPRLEALLAARAAWLDGARGVAAGVAHVVEAAVQLECSRRGRLWEPGALCKRLVHAPRRSLAPRPRYTRPLQPAADPPAASRLPPPFHPGPP